jgi:hypothetical protein
VVVVGAGGDNVVDVETGVDEVEGTLGTENGDKIGGDGGGGGGRGNSKISTTFDSTSIIPLIQPPPKNILV